MGRIDVLNAHLGFKAELAASVYVQAGERYKYGFEDARIQINLNGQIKAWVDVDMDARSATLMAQAKVKFGVEVDWHGNAIFDGNILEDVDTKEEELYRYKL